MQQPVQFGSMMQGMARRVAGGAALQRRSLSMRSRPSLYANMLSDGLLGKNIRRVEPLSKRFLTTTHKKPTFHWLDLRGSGLSVLERLLLEECLLKSDPQNRQWMMVGWHEPCTNKHVWMKPLKYMKQAESDDTIQKNESVCIVMGLGGKPSQLLDVPAVHADGVLCLKRFTGGGTVVLDFDSIWTTVIGRPNGGIQGLEDANHNIYPRPIMEWTASEWFGPLFEQYLFANNDENNKSSSKETTENSSNQWRTLVMESKSCCGLGTLGPALTLPKQHNTSTDDKTKKASLKFALREHDYVAGDFKMGGNAQAITKEGWLHHTSWLWDWQPSNMEYLTLPSKRPDYRKDRPHSDFLLNLSDYTGKKKQDMITGLLAVSEERFDIVKVPLAEAMAVVKQQHGSLDEFWKTSSRTKVVDMGPFLQEDEKD